MTFAMNFWVASLFLTSAFTLFLGYRIYSLAARFRNPYFAALLLAISGWSIFYGVEIAVEGIENKIVFASIEYLFITLIAPLWMFTTLIICERDYTPPPNYVRASLVIPVITALLALTNDAHHLVWRSFELVELPSASFLEVEHGPFFWIYATYSYILILFGAARMFRSVFGAARVFWVSRLAMLVGGLLPLMFNMMYLFELGPSSYVDLSPFAFSFSVIAYVYVYFKRNVAILQPISRASILDLVPMGVVVLTEDGVVMDSNSAFADMISNAKSVGRSIVDVFPEVEASVELHQMLPIFDLERQGRRLRVRTQSVEANHTTFQLMMLEDITSQQLTELALADTNAQIREMMEFMPLGIFETNSQGLLVAANKTGLEMTGYSETDIGTKSIVELLGSENSAQVDEYKTKWADGKQFTAEFSVVRRDGSRLPVVTQSVPLKKDGQLSGFRGYSIDLSSQKKAQAQLAESQDLYRTLVEISPFGIIVCTPDRVSFSNETMKDLLGVPTTDTVLAFQPQHLILQSDTGEEELSLLDILRSPEDRGSLTGINFNKDSYELEYRRSQIKQSEKLLYLVLFEDVSERRQNLVILDEAKQRYQALFASAREIICITDFYGQILDVNNAALDVIAFNKSEIIGSNLVDLVAADDFEKVVELQRTLKSNSGLLTNYPTKFKLLDRVGRTIIADVAITQIRQKDGPPHLQFVARDVTYEHEINADLKAEKEIAELVATTKSDFLATMSHEIRTPLNSILGIAQLLAMQSMPSDQLEKVQRILRSGDFLLDILNGILDLSKMEAGKLKLYPVRFTTRELFSDVYQMFTHLAADKDLDYKLVVDSAVPDHFMGDETRIKQIFSNLLSNAFKFTHEGRVQLQVELASPSDHQDQNSQYLRVAITDTGIGMEPSKSDMIFDKFSQEDVTIEQRFGGTGLGLTICLNLVDLMKGTIEVETEKDLGSKFTVYLPLLAESPQQNEPISKIAKGIVDLRGKSILVAEDDQLNQLLISEILESFGCEFLCVGDGVQAVDALRARHFDVVLMDIQMPHLNGYQATTQIRELPGPVSQIAIIALTAENSEDGERLRQAAGFTGFVSKPINIQYLADTLSNLLLI